MFQLFFNSSQFINGMTSKNLGMERLPWRKKKHNRKLSEMQVVVENSIRVMKTFRILGSMFCHWCDRHGQIDADDVVCICANWRIKKKPLHAPDWKTKEWQAGFKQE
jgi:hypothetical protein